VTTLTVTVPASLDGVRVDKAVSLVADLSRSTVNTLVDRGCVRIDGVTVRSRSTALRLGQELEVDHEEEQAPGVPAGDAGVSFDVVFADREVVVVDKPAGLVVHPGPGHRTGTLVHGLLARFPDIGALPQAVGSDPERPGIVHRLDRGTSGLMVAARSPRAYHSLVDQLSRRDVTRSYRALVLGSVDGTSGLVDAPIGRSVSSPTRMAVSRKGKAARTRYHVDRRFGEPVPTTLLTATLETGRTHQIRVHLTAIGHPLVGDDVYGQGRPLPGAVIARPFLHAAGLTFLHPGTGEAVSWTSELPDDLRRQLDLLGD